MSSGGRWRSMRSTGRGTWEPGRIFAGGYPGDVGPYILLSQGQGSELVHARGCVCARWHTFARANRVASYHERLWLAASAQRPKRARG